MKYVRTKDNIYELNPINYESPMCLDGKTITTCVYTKNQEWVAKNDILKQTDKIEELCDGFVVVCNGRSLKHKYFKTFDKAQKYYRDLTLCAYSKSQVKIYGIICSYNDKLIPELKTVAKLNDKEDLELI